MYYTVTIPQGQHHVSSAQQSQALFGGICTWMSDQLRIPRVVIFSFFSFPFEGGIKDCRTPQPCVMSFFLFLSYLFLISPCPHFVYLQYHTIIQINSPTRHSNSSQFSYFWSSKTITSILLLSVVLLKPCCHHYNPRYDTPH